LYSWEGPQTSDGQMISLSAQMSAFSLYGPPRWHNIHNVSILPVTHTQHIPCNLFIVGLAV